MSKFNSKSSTKTINKAGGEAFSETPELELASLVLTSFVEDKFYESGNEQVERLKSLSSQIKDKKFLAKLAIYARTKYGMRSISHVISGEIAKNIKGAPWLKSYFEKVIYRPDDITETLAYYLGAYKKPIPNSLKKGLGKAFGKFNAYNLAKYRGEGKDVTLVDAVNLVHPKPNGSNEEALKMLMRGELKSTDTWESKLTKAGQEAETEEEKAELKASAWKELIKENKLGYFAALRNIRNISEQAPELIDDLCKILTDEKQIKKSLVLPFRFVTALENVENMDRRIIIALSKAIDISLGNMPKLGDKVLVVLDVSGSMKGKPSSIGSLFAATLFKNNNADIMVFADNAKYLNANPLDSTLSIAKSFKFASGGTNFHSIFETIKKAYDTIVILSDMQGWIGYNAPVAEFNKYRKECNCNPKIISYDLNGYGSLQFPQSGVYCVAGFSEKTLEVLSKLVDNKNALIDEINSIQI